MNFAIYGVNFTNKGAELMLHSVKQKVKSWDQNNSLAAQLMIGSYKKRKEVGIDHLAWQASRSRTTKKTKITSFIGSLIPVPIRRKYNIVLESEIEVILDASGFAFSDQWPPEKTEETARRCLRWKNQGKKIIFLPQAFGPFENKRTRQAFLSIINNADLICARDRISYEHVINISGADRNIKLFPDFTNLIESTDPEYISELSGRPCIVPNQRMIDMTTSDVSNTYVSFLISSLKHLREKGLDPFLLIHESDDSELGVYIQGLVDEKVQIIQEENPLHLKGIINKSFLVIGSRFHSLVSSLSQSTPCLGTGWSHKYKMLFEDYNCLDLLIDVSSNTERNLDTLDLLIETSSRERIVAKIREGATEQKRLSKEMWIEVEKLLNV